MHFKRFIQNILYPFSENPKNKKLIKKYKKPEVIYAFYHIYAVNNWKEIFDDQISYLKKSGIHEIINKLYISLISYNDEDEEYIKECLGNKVEIIYKTDKADVYEFPALNYLYNKSINSKKNFFILYFHTKGSSNSQKNVEFAKKHIKNLKTLRKFSKNSRDFMQFWNISKYRLAIAALENGYDTYGCAFNYEPNSPFYPGNFWWTTSDYVKTRIDIKELDWSYRYNAETWLIDTLSQNYYDAYRFNPDLNEVIVSKYYYSDNRVKHLLGIGITYCHLLRFYILRMLKIY